MQRSIDGTDRRTDTDSRTDTVPLQDPPAYHAISTGLAILAQLMVMSMALCSGKSGPKDQVALRYYYTSPSHWCTTHEVSKL